MRRFIGTNGDQFAHVVANGPLAVFVEGSGKPKRRVVWQRTKTGIEMIKARIDKFDRNDQAAEHFGDGAMRLNIGTKFVAAKKHIAAKERIAFPFEIQILWQPVHFIAAFLHPFCKEWLLAGALWVAKIARDKFFFHSQSGVGGKDHVGKFWLRRDQVNLAIQLRESRVQFL